MGLLISVGKDAKQIIKDTKELLTLSFKILISLITIVQDVEDILLEMKELSDMVHFSINAMDRQKVDTKIGKLKNYAGELGQRVKEKHERLNVVAMLLEDLMKVRYGKDWRDAAGSDDGRTIDNDSKNVKTGVTDVTIGQTDVNIGQTEVKTGQVNAKIENGKDLRKTSNGFNGNDVGKD